MQSVRWFAPILASLLITGAQAQLRGRSPGSVGTVHIRVMLGNDRNAGPYLQVRLMDGGSGTMIGNTYTNDVGEASFVGVPVGNYHVEISGDGIETTESETFEVDSRKMSQSEWVAVRRLEDSGPKPVSARSTISASDMNVPGKARKELEKANEAMALRNWKKSQEHLNQAIALAPSWVTAYNNLGVLYAKMNDIPREEEAFKKAISLDGHFAPSLLNYGKLCLRQKNFSQAEEFLQKASTVEPDNPETLMLLADAAYMDHHFDLAITSAHQAHTAGHDHPTFVHYIAARAYQQKNQQAEALAEFKLFLQEEPKGPRADHVRGDIAKIPSATQVSAQ